MNALVLHYSKSGNNRYLARQCAEALSADSEEIKPRLDVFPFLALFSFVKKSAGIKRLSHTIADYDHVILVGPIWMGQFLSPLRDVVRRYRRDIRNLWFMTCCGGGEAEKDSRFGYESVFAQVRAEAGERCRECAAFPVSLALPEEKRGDSDAVMKARLSDETFTGELRQRLEAFVQKVRETNA
jgi:multimeric flavodoxin WrbA